MIRFDRDQADWGSTKIYPDGVTDFNLDKIVIHWGGNTDPDGTDDVATEPEEAAILRAWQRFHINGRGWSDIAYSYAFGNTGLTYRCRGYNRNGATSGDIDHDGIGEGSEALALVWIGGTQGEPSQAAYEAMGRAIRDVFDQHGPVPVTVHSDHKATACPGDAWRAWAAREGWNDETGDDDMSFTSWANGLFDEMSDSEIIDLGRAGYWQPGGTQTIEEGADYWIGLRDLGAHGRSPMQRGYVARFIETCTVSSWENTAKVADLQEALVSLSERIEELQT